MKVTTYAELKKFVSTFAKGHFRLLGLVGPPGTAKTTIVKEQINGSARHISANLSAFELYRELWKHRNKDFVIDDVDNLLRDPPMIRLLKALCDTQETRTIRWLTATTRLGDDGDDDKPPREFETTSRVIIVGNDWGSLNENVKAVNDRGFVIYFEPTPQEIHRHALGWFPDKEILKFIGERLHLLGGRHSLRYYVRALEWKRAKLDWRNLLVRDWQIDPKVARLMQLLADQSLTQAKRAAIFTTEGHGSRRNFFYLCAKLREAGAVAACTSAPTPSAKVQGKPSRARTVRRTAPSKKAHEREWLRTGSRHLRRKKSRNLVATSRIQRGVQKHQSD